MAGEEDKLAGKAKELGGKVSGDKRLESEGQTQNAAGKVEGAVDEAKQRAQGVLDAVEKKRDDRGSDR
jgi:uncharacterized protein YjbJ (UPF0337 family)